MATNRDVKMTLSVDTLGEDGIKSLQKSIQSLAAEGGDAAPEFQKLADEVGRLGEQSKALTAFKDLGALTEALTTKQTEAVASSQRLAAQLVELRANTDAAKVKQTEAAAALAAGQVATLEASSALRILKADYDNAGKQTAEFRSKQTELIAAQTAAKVALVELRAAQKNANTELADAEVAQKKVERAYSNTNKAVDAATTALSKQEVAVKEAATATEKLGLSATDVATSEGVLLAALNKVGSEAAQHSAAIKEMAESDRLLAIQEKGLAELYARGADALQAETLAQRDADRSNAEYAASLAKVNAEKARSVDTAAQWQREAEAIVNAAEAAQKLERDTIDLLNAERQLADNNAFAQHADDAKKLAQAADYVQFWTTELDRADAAAKQLQGAFNALNVRSAEAIKADITAVRSALETVRSQATATGQSLSGAFDAGKAKIQALEREMRQLNGTMTLGDKAAGVLSNSLGQISAGNIVADGVGYLVNKVKELGRAFIEAVVQGDQMRRGLNAVYKDTELTARQIDFLRKTASESGVSLGALSGEFVRFSASMKSANVPMAESNALFRAVTAASASLGLGAEATSGALNALGQMASKGTVSMEELRQQLGDRLPGALGLAAKGMGITEGQLIALVSSGGLATRDFIVPFTNALETMRGEVDGLTPAWGRFGTALTTIAQNSGDAGWVQILTVGLKLLAGVVGTVVMSFSLASEGVIFLAKAMTAAAARMMGDKDAFKFLAEEADKAATRINASNEALKNVINPSAAAAAATTTHAVAMTTATAKVTEAIAANSALSAEQKLLALSTALATDKTLDASAKMVQYGVAASELIGKQGQQIEAFGKLAKAAKEEGDTLVALAKLTGDVNAVQVASVQAAELHATALDKLTQAQSSELAMLVAQKSELLANSKQRRLTELQIKTQVDALDALIKKSEAETVQTQQASAAAAQLVLERRLLIATTKDHSAEVDKLRAAMELAARVSSVYEEAARRGAVTDAQAMEKRRELATATALYRDALNDVITKSKLVEATAQADIATTKSVISNKITHNDLLIKEATLRGDLVTVEKLELVGKQLVIDQMKLEIASRTSANNAILAQNEAARKLIDGSTDLGKQQLKELDISDKLTKAKQAMNLASGDVVKGLEKEVVSEEKLFIARNKANLEAVNAKTLNKDYAKSIGDLDRASKGLTETMSEETKARIDGAQSKLDSAQASYDQAVASGDEIAAAEALVKVKEAELALAKVLADAKREEARAAREVAAAKAVEAKAAQETADAIAREIANAETVTAAMKAQAAEAKVNAIAKAGAAKEAYAHADALDVEAKAADRNVEKAKNALTVATNGLNKVRAAAAEATSAVNETIAAFDPLKKVKDDLNAVTSALSQAGNTAKDLEAATNLTGDVMMRLGDEDLSTLRGAIADANQRMDDLEKSAQDTLNSIQDELDQLNSNFGDIEKREYASRKLDLETQRDKAASDGNYEAVRNLEEAIRKLDDLYNNYKIPEAAAKEKDVAQKRLVSDPAPTSPIGTPTQTPASSNKTVTININGRSQSVNVASDADATALTSILRTLETAANTSS